MGDGAGAEGRPAALQPSPVAAPVAPAPVRLAGAQAARSSGLDRPRDGPGRPRSWPSPCSCCPLSVDATPRRSAARRTAARRCRPRSPTSPFADWTVYHIMVEMFAQRKPPGNDGEIRRLASIRITRGGDLQGISGAGAGYLAGPRRRRRLAEPDLRGQDLARLRRPQLLPDRRRGGRAGRRQGLAGARVRRLVQDLHSPGHPGGPGRPAEPRAARPTTARRAIPGSSSRAPPRPGRRPRRSGRAGEASTAYWDFEPRADPPLPARTPPYYWLRERRGRRPAARLCARRAPRLLAPSSTQEVKQAKPGAWLVGEAWHGRRAGRRPNAVRDRHLLRAGAAPGGTEPAARLALRLPLADGH